MSEIIRCPDCGKPVSVRFPIHDCRSVLKRKDPTFAELSKKKDYARLEVARIEGELARAKQTLREAEKEITLYWRKKGARG